MIQTIPKRTNYRSTVTAIALCSALLIGLCTIAFAPSAIASIVNSTPPFAQRTAPKDMETWTKLMSDHFLAHQRMPLRENSDQAIPEGVVQIEIYIAPSGQLMQIDLAKSSGSAQLDQAGMLSIQEAAPFIPLPPGFEGQVLKLSIPLVYKFRKSGTDSQ